MRQIGSERELEQKRKRNVLVLSLFMLAVLVIGTAGYAFLSNPNPQDVSAENNNQEKVRFDGTRWVLIMDSENFYFLNSPDSAENISVNTTLSLFNYKGMPLYIASDNNAVNSEIASTVGRYASRVQQACYGSCGNDLPEKNCTENLIIWKDSAENKVYQEENCVFIEGDMSAVDAFLYRLFGI